MKNFEKETYALQDADGNLIGVDLNSGGYPWVPDYLSGVWFTSQADGAKGYRKTFPHFKVARVKITVEEVT